MQWLILNIWIILAIVAAFALAFGWSFRGLMATRGVRRAQIERDVVQTELSQARSEIEALYAAQRKGKTGESDAKSEITALTAQLAERDVSLNQLNDELASARADVERLMAEAKDTSGGLQAASAGVLGAVAGAVATGLTSDTSETAELAQIKERNAWLEERVTQLESDVAQTSMPDATPVEVSVAHEKMQWRTHYLDQRVGALEAALMSARGPQEATPTPVATNAGHDADMARLRWRNRYLEGRLAYYEGQSADIAEATRRDSGPVESLVEAVAEEQVTSLAETTQPSETTAEPLDATETVSAEISTDTDIKADADPDTTDPAADEDPVETPSSLHPSDAMLAEMDEAGLPAEPDMVAEIELVAPNTQAKPSGGGDDLTQIDGIGPRIAEVLNGLGIWTFVQIAEWTPENAAWVDDHLAFSGRVARENWVAQAGTAANTTASETAS